MGKLKTYTSLDLYRELKGLRTNIDVKKKFPDQVAQIDQLLANDKTGLVSTVVDFMVHTATVNMKIETSNATLDKTLQHWQKSVLNKDVNIDIPRGLRALSTENFRERWRSSLLALKVIWGEVNFANQGTFIVPKKMWFLDGASILTESNGGLNNRKYSVIINKKSVQLTNGKKDSIFIRKPYTAWHQDKVTPYLVKRGTMFNSLIKEAIVRKQSDVIESVIPLLLKLQAGNDKLALEGMNVSPKAFKDLKDQLVDGKQRFDQTHNFGDLIASLRHDVKLDYLIPDLEKIFDESIVKSTDRNILSSLGLIELQGFSSNRQEAILNPKVLVEEIVDAVKDWATLLEDVMMEMMERNREEHPNLANNTIRVVPGNIKAFITDEMKSLLRSMYDRGVISKQTGVEDIAGIDFEVEVERRTKESERDLDTIMKPPVIQNLEQHLDVENPDNQNLEDQDKLPGTPEADNFNNAILQLFADKHLKTKKKKKKKTDKDYSSLIINTPDELPEEIQTLPLPAQLTYFMTYNTSIEDDVSQEESHKLANESIQMFLVSNTKKTKDVKIEAKNEVKCNNCDKKFDYDSVSEIAMGAVQCPHCDEIIDQTGRVVGQKEEEMKIPLKIIDDLPKNVKEVITIPAQLIWLETFNSVFEETKNQERAIRYAWTKVSEKFEKQSGLKKWVKKVQLEDYKSEMSGYAYKLFGEMYNEAFDHCSSNNDSINIALSIIKRYCAKNSDGVWVKNKKLTKGDIDKLDKPDFISRMLDLELKEEKLKLIKKLNKDKEEE